MADRIEHVETNTLEAIQELAQNMDERFDEVHAEIGSMKSEIGGVKSGMGSMKSEMAGLKSEMGSMRAQVVTKDYLDEKLADQFSDVVQFVRRRVSCWKDIGVQKTR